MRRVADLLRDENRPRDPPGPRSSNWLAPAPWRQPCENVATTGHDMSTAITRAVAYGRFRGAAATAQQRFHRSGGHHPDRHVPGLHPPRRQRRSRRRVVPDDLDGLLRCRRRRAEQHGLSAIEERELDWLQRRTARPRHGHRPRTARRPRGDPADRGCARRRAGELRAPVPRSVGSDAGTLVLAATPFALLGVAIGYGVKTTGATTLDAPESRAGVGRWTLDPGEQLPGRPGEAQRVDPDIGVRRAGPRRR